MTHISEEIGISKKSVDNDEFNLSEIITAVNQGKWFILITTVVVTLCVVLYALKLPNIYKSEVLLSPASADAGMKIPGQLGGLAALAGVNLGGGGNGDKTQLAIALMKSRDFIGRFIERHDALPALMAVQKWDPNTNQFVFNPTIYDEKNKEWVRKVSAPAKPKPSLQEAYKQFIGILSIDLDKNSGFVKVSIEHMSPGTAQFWLSNFVNDIDDELRARDVKDAERSIEYLSKQVEQTNVAEIRSVLFALIEEQTKTLMLAHNRDEYAFKIIDPAVVPETKDRPKRAVMSVLALMLSFIFSLLLVIIRHIMRK